MLIDELTQHIYNQGIAVLGSTLFGSHLPPEPEAAIAVIDTGGLEPDMDLPTRHPTFQVFIRSTTYATGKVKLELIRSTFHQIANTTLIPGGTYFYYIFAISEGGHLGKNPEGLHEFSINFRARTR